MVVEQFAILKKIRDLQGASSLLGVGAGRAHAPNKAPGLYALTGGSVILSSSSRVYFRAQSPLLSCTFPSPLEEA